MKKSCISSLALLIGLITGIGYAQQPPSFTLDAYKQFLSSHKDLTGEQLTGLYDAGRFKVDARTNVASAAYYDSVALKYSLTDDEKSLLAQNGFMVTERLSYGSFGRALADVYHNDLPVFISSDAILHAIHDSYDAILMSVEESMLIARLDSLLAGLHKQLPILAEKYSAYPAMKQMLNDVDVYLTVPRALLGGSSTPCFAGNSGKVDTLLRFVATEGVENYPLFSSANRKIDFSQFTTRGHYTCTPELSRYFKAMIWLGKMEIYLIAPESYDNKQTDADIQRQTIDAVLVKELADSAHVWVLLDEIDGTLEFFVGESDNATLHNVASVDSAINLKDADELLDTLRWKEFQDTLSTKSYASQRILSQVLISDPMDPEQIKPASSFLLLGQRFVIDSYVAGSVVYDKIMYQGGKVWRALPSTLDVLFAIGNDAAAQLLQPELDEYRYSSNLSALRYLVDSYGEEFWTVSMYNGWLNSIRALNPPQDRTALPSFMQTAAWWQEKMNTQLASWAQLRHDNLLYAKQSYTAGTICSFPEGYVEPFPGFYEAVKTYARVGETKFQQPSFSNSGVAYYFGYLKNVADTLGSISRKELSGTQLLDSEKGFLKRMLFDVNMCGAQYDGWYMNLFYGFKTALDSDMVVADVHTCPTDEGGGMVGWVLHAGTGPVNMAVVVTAPPDGRLTTFVGPAMSYYEHVSTNFKRLTDEEWKTMYALTPSFRPPLVNIYLANASGSRRGEGPSLLTAIKDKPLPEPSPRTLVLAQNFPNPFNSTTIIAFTVPPSLSHSKAEVIIYNINGQVVKRLLERELPAGNYSVRWSGVDERGVSVASGVYFYRLSAGGARASGKLVLIK